MRRTKSEPGISPRQLKHFAVAAVAVTGLLALFVSGEDWGAQAQLKAVQAKNDLAAKQVERSGATKIGASMAVRAPTNLGFGDEAGPGSMGQGSGGGAGPAPMPHHEGRAPMGPPGPQGDAPPHGPTTTTSGKRIVVVPDGKSPLRGTQQGNADSQQVQRIEDASRQRSGRPS